MNVSNGGPKADRDKQIDQQAMRADDYAMRCQLSPAGASSAGGVQMSLLTEASRNIAALLTLSSAEQSVGQSCRLVSLPIPGGAKVLVEVYYSPAVAPSFDDPGEPAECWVERILVSTASGDRLVSVPDLIKALEDDERVMAAAEAGR